MIPALWLAAIIVRDRPYSSYSSSRGGWSHKVFWRVFPIAFLCISVPIIVNNLFVEHLIGDFRMKFTLASFLVLTILGPLQCIAEEYAFRGLLMQTFGSWLRVPVIAVILQSVVFVLMHPYDMYGKAEIFISGMVFAVTAWLGRGIEVSAAFHICNNMTIFYLQGMNMATISSDSSMEGLIFSAVCGVAYVVIIFIVSKKTDWFNSVGKDDVAAWNEKYDAKLARKAAKKAAKAEKRAAKNAPIGTHEESSAGKHFKQ
jgi:membrane protease YdiL (CAAX protease family)